MLENLSKIVCLGFCFLLFALLSFAQNNESGKPRVVEILRANSLEYNEASGVKAKRLLGDVVFRHEEAYMFCDSAWFFDESNTIQAYNNVRIKQGDSVLIIGKYLEYDGNSKIAKMRDSVILKHNKSFLITDSLDYDRNIDVAYYFEGGKIYDEDNRLFSRRGYYHTKEKDYYAVDTVLLKNPQYDIFSDTLKYNTESRIAYFFGPTNIVADSNHLYCELGYYDTSEDKASLSDNAWLRSSSNYLYGDSLFYDRKIRFGEAFMNVSVVDTVENMYAKGNYGYYYEQPQNAMLTDNTEVIYISDGDSIFMHADTVYISVDSLDYKLMRAFYKVQVFKSDMQARCDSLVFYSFDSIAHMFYSPVLWSDNNQITADHIEMYFLDKKPNKFFLNGNAFAIEQYDSLHYNQLKSRKMSGYIVEKKLRKIDLHNDCQTIYFIVDEEVDEIVAINKVLSSNMTIWLKNNKIENVWFYDKPDGETIPIEQLSKEQIFLKDFRFLDEYRPKSRDDIFIWKEIPSKD
ncbi:MAG: organic solvent tolerance protein OstA [Bacteroidales bacterium]|jgi:lipopolysaccharide export system protein LptA|nr:OstA-like protein [Bacteroidales bacterium]NLB85934.1 organic solvent tolerance protein OstA [Bacteroidales bacterium]